MYLVVLTRPDLSYTVSYLSQFNNCSNETHWKHLKRVLRYLKGTKDQCLTFNKDDIGLEGFVDADWGGNLVDRKSYNGFVFKFCGGSVSWESRKPKTVGLSSTEAEYMALTEASKEATYLKNLYHALPGECITVPLYNDSQSAQKLVYNPVLHKKSKHIDIKYHFIREVVFNNCLVLRYQRSDDMCTDILTKGLVSVKHIKFVSSLGIFPK